MKSSFVVRIRLVFVGVALFALILVVRLYFVQIVYGEEFSARADRQYTRPTQDLYDRGAIFMKDRDGRLVSAAALKSGFTVAINPSILKDPKEAYRRLSAIIPIEEEYFFSRAAKKDDPYEEVARQVHEDEAIRIDALSIEGLRVYKDRWRYYPGSSLAAHAVGFVAYQGDELSGRYGLERYYDDTLSRDESGLYVNFFAEIFANVRGVLSESSSSRKGDIITTLEPSVQLFLENQLEEIHTAWNARQTAGIIINPKSGEIYALSVYPSFDLNDFKNEESSAVFTNPLVENVFEMGSIIKPLTMAAGLDSGTVTAEATYYDPGRIELSGYTISNFDGQGRGEVNMQEVLNQSLNTGAAYVVNRMGKETFRSYMDAFEIGEETGIDLPNESAGLVDNLNSPRELEYATASFGQGIAMTPIATVRALAVLANGGTLVTPHLGSKIKYQSGLSKEILFNEGTRVIKEETSEEITRMLVSVVDEALLAGAVKKERYSIAAKTGTAQIANPAGGGYYNDRFLHSFFGYFPAYDPTFLIFLYTREPQGVRYASQTLTEPFMETVDFLINYYEIPPDR